MTLQPRRNPARLELGWRRHREPPEIVGRNADTRGTEKAEKRSFGLALARVNTWMKLEKGRLTPCQT